MFSSALKSFTSNISANYTIAPQPSSTSGPWRIFDAKRKSTGKAASVFVLDRKALEPHTGGLSGGRSGGSSLKRAQEEVLERLKLEASSLARLRHPSILELAEPVEETSKGGLMFATELVTASLASLLSEKDEQERSGGVGGRGSRFVVEEQDGTRHRRELEIDELEIQKGLLQLAKGLEFLHESAGLVHANLTPDAILINAKGDWKISGLGFCGPHETSTAATSLAPIQLFEVLNHDPRLPRGVQLNLDYTSPDFVLDNSLVPSADMFSLGLLILALYNSPHSSPLSTGGSLASYKRIFSSSASVPTQNNNFLVPSTNPLPPKLKTELLPKLITRRAANRLSAREFQEASYFDNILVSTMRFLDALPAKTPSEKTQFMRGLPRIMPQFPKSVLEKKVLPALLEEMKDKDILALILTNVFAMIKAMPSGKRAFTDKVVPRLREIFLVKPAAGAEKDTGRDAGLMVLLENMEVAAQNCAGKEFRDHILPILLLALESTTHSLVDAALQTLPHVLPVLDFSTIKRDLFPVIANGFAKTSSLAIKVRGLEAFYTLCGGTPDGSDDDLNGIGVSDKKASSSSVILDKFTVQEKVVPMLKGIKTKEPGVMMAALRVFKQVGEVADSDFLAMEVLPLLWQFSLGPLLNLQQFQAFMSLIKTLSGKIEREQTRKLQEMGTSTAGQSVGARNTNARSGASSSNMGGLSNGEETDFETLVFGRKPTSNGNGDLMNDWGPPQPARSTSAATQYSSPPATSTPTFSWQTPAPAPSQSMNALRPAMQHQASRTVTPDHTMSSFAALTPASQWSQPLQPSAPSAMPLRPAQNTATNTKPPASTIDWSSAMNNSTSTWGSQKAAAPSSMNSFTIAPPPMSPQATGYGGMGAQQQQQSGGQKSGLDKYQSLI